MRVLHTSDWHVGKRLGRYDRIDDHAAVLDEVCEIADAEAVDLVVISGDLFDRSVPPLDALALALDALRRLARPGRPVVAIAGNHDSAELFELLAPLLVDHNIHLVGAIKRPDAGGVLSLSTRAGPAAVACFPFLREGRVVDFLADVDDWYGTYAERVHRLCHAYDKHLGATSRDAVALLLGHFMIDGVKLGTRTDRGERALHIGGSYMATEQALPPNVQYVALGHIHAPQNAPGAVVPAAYAGSLLELDFGEAGEEKRVVIVDAEPGQPASMRSVAVTRGRRLVRAAGRRSELAERADLQDVFVDLTVLTDGPDPSLAEWARERFPYLVRVRAEYARASVDVDAPRTRSRPWDELFIEYHEREHEASPGDDLIGAFRAILEEVESATS